MSRPIIDLADHTHREMAAQAELKALLVLRLAACANGEALPTTLTAIAVEVLNAGDPA